MDIVYCLISSWLGKLAYIHLQTTALLPIPPAFPSTVLLSLTLLKAYCIHIYPNLCLRLPGPKDHHPFLGQTLNQFLSGDPTQPYVSWIRKWPSAHLIRYTFFGTSPAVLAASPEAFRQILQPCCYAFTKPAWYKRLIFPIVGNGLVFQDGEEHKRTRKILSGAFALSHLKQLIPLIETKAVELCNHLDAVIDYDRGVINPVIPPLSRITLDVIGSTVLGTDLQSLESVTPFHEIYQTVFDPPVSGLVLTAINSIVPIRWISVGENRRFNRAIAKLHELLRGVIRERIADAENEKVELTGAGRRDLLTRMIQESQAAGENWDEEDLIGHVLTFMAAGHETTSNTLAWAIHYLGLNRQIQDRLRKEVIDAMGRTGFDMDYNTIERIQLLDNLYHEVLRAIHDVEICGTVIPKGTTIMLMPSAIHQNPRIWGDSVDEFDPDRWDRLEGEAAKSHSFAAFFMGPRGCIGQVFTRLEFKIMMIAIFRRFEFDAIEKGEITLVNPSVVLRPKGGLRVFAHRLTPTSE
ncbi:hypothetical protein jhhlp_007742 [Lomentospora prolificans]|uniref:Cytochrome P450 n=1 Tax=Lomentospora prolificans TaxID=41688 RepID=A0A2N3N0F6_9PEZI|nr:hypothetical protein jhhlp_007742 [Lomentospora prolificans]